MKFYGIDSLNPIQIGTPSNDDTLTNLLAWDPTDGEIKYRDVSSISGGGGSGSQTLKQVLNTGNDAGTYSIKFRGTQSEIYTITAGTSFSGFGAGMESILAITSSAFAFDPIITQNTSGLSILNSTIGAIVWDGSASGLSKKAWMRSQNDNESIYNSIYLDSASVCASSNRPSTTQSSIFQTSPSTSAIFTSDPTSSTSIQVNNEPASIIFYSNNLIANQCVEITPSSVSLNGSAGTNGQVVSINSTGQFCWQTISGSGGGGSTIIDSCEVAFGTGTGVTSSDIFVFDCTNKNLKVSYNSTIDNTIYNSGIIFGTNHILQYSSSDSSIIGGNCNKIENTSIRSSIIGGDRNHIYSNAGSVILGGFGGTISNSSLYSTINNGHCNVITSDSCYSSIHNGYFNLINTNSCLSTIIGGCCNTIQSSIGSAIIGGCGLNLYNEPNLVQVPELKLATASNDDSLTKVLVWDEVTTKKMMWRDVSTIGGSDPDFLYINTAFVHPDGNDGTAVIGDFSLPFATITGALTALKSGPSPDPVIEIWPKNSVRGSAPTYLPSTSYDYILNTNLVIDINIKIHLKAGVRIRYTGDYGVDTPLFYVSDDKAAGILLTVTSEDSSSTIEVINGNGYEHLITILDGSQAVFENVTIYSESQQTSSTPIKLDSNGFAAIIGVDSKMVIRNCLFYNNPPATDYSGNVYMLENAVFESWNSRLINIQPADASSTHIYQDSIGEVVTGYSVVRLHDTVAVQRNTFGRSGLSNLIDVNSDAKCYLMMGNSTFWFSDIPEEKIGGNAGVRPLTNNSSNDAYVQYTSRSIHNYEPTTYFGSWIEVSGEADSSTALGAYGFGQFQYYTSMYEPFDTV